MSRDRFRARTAGTAIHASRRVFPYETAGSYAQKIRPLSSHALGAVPRVAAEARIQTKLALMEAVRDTGSTNWDGYGAKIVSDRAVAHALRFVDYLPPDVPEPDVAPSRTGELTFHWHIGPRQTFSVSINESGRAAYAGLFGTRTAHGIEEVGEGMPPFINAGLQRLYETGR